jgi:carbamate kinase
VTTVVALGGHALDEEDSHGPLVHAVESLGPGPLVITHGNGPQVGAELLRAPETPLHVAVAKTQGELGTELARMLAAVAVVTHVVVDEDDPAFARPTKPIGPVYDEEAARKAQERHGWRMGDDGGRGLRRLVPSPHPTGIVELEAVRALLGAGTRVIACGGGGIPVARRRDGLHGIDAVIDKDWASSLLATELGATRLVVLTNVAAVCRDYGEPGETPLPELTPADVDGLAPGLPEGSMRPKLLACAEFVRATGGEALVTSPQALADALAGRAGTRVAQ